MKSLIITLSGIFMILYSSALVNGQKIMALNEGLKTSVTPLEAKRKGMSSVGKYEFGPYRIVSSKGGASRTKSTRKLLSFKSNSETTVKSSFVFVSHDRDTLNVTTSSRNNLTETEIASLSIMNYSSDNYLVSIAPANDTTVWKMFVVFSSGEDVADNFHAQGTLSDGKTNIVIREVKLWEDGKPGVMNSICGYEFYLGDSPVAAVQSSIDTFQKKYVWLSLNPDEGLRSVLAAASAAIMVHTDTMLSGMD